MGGSSFFDLAGPDLMGTLIGADCTLIN